MPNEKDAELFNKIHNKTIICVGNDLYDDASNYSRLKVCKEDAKSLFDVFTKKKALKCAKEDATLIINDENQKVSKQVVLNSINNLLTKTDIQQFVFYFSGHGDLINDELALVMKESKKENKESFLMLNEIVELINKIQCKEKIVILDACYSGVATQQGTKATTRKTIGQLIDKSKGMTFIASSLNDQESYAKSPSSHSLFTHFLIDSLLGNSDALQDNYLTLFNMYEFIVKNIKAFCHSASLKDQTPSIKCVQDGIMYLGYYGFDEHSWYKDNYEKILLQSKENKLDKYLYEIECFLDSNLRDDSYSLICELMINAFVHGKATKCEVIVNKNNIEVIDDGGLFNQLKLCQKEDGGMSYHYKDLQTKWAKNVECIYDIVNDNNYYKITFNNETAFDISKRMCFKPDELILTSLYDFFVPDVTCKYYFVEIPKRTFFTMGKDFIDRVLEYIPKDSFLLLLDNEKNRLYASRNSRIKIVQDDCVIPFFKK